MFDTFDKHVDKSLSILRSDLKEEAGRYDVQELMARYTLESIGIIGFGVSVGALDDTVAGASASSSFGDAFNTATVRTADRFIDPTWPVKRLLAKCGLMWGGEKELRDSVGVIRAFAIKVIEERREEIAQGGEDLSSKPDLLSRFMAKEKGGADKGKKGSEFEFSNEELYFIIVNFVLAGRDTTAVSLTWTLWELAKRGNRSAVEKIREEGTRLRREMGIEKGVVTHELIAKSQYLKAVIQESLRLHPPVPLDIKEAEKDDVLPDGTEVRAGDRVMFLTWSMARMQDQWGEDCLDFKPDRFLKDGAFKPPEGSKLPIFLAGPRLCLGKEMAMLSSGLMLSKMLDAFDVEGGDEVEPKYEIGLTIWVDGKMPLVLKERVL